MVCVLELMTDMIFDKSLFIILSTKMRKLNEIDGRSVYLKQYRPQIFFQISYISVEPWHNMDMDLGKEHRDERETIAIIGHAIRVRYHATRRIDVLRE